MLLVPTITKNLVSVSRFAKDNQVYFEFHPSFCVVKSQDNHQVLLRGQLNENGLYLFPSFLSSTKLLLEQPSLLVALSIQHLGLVFIPNPSQNVQTLIPTSVFLCHNRLGHLNKISDLLCSSWCLGKSHRLSFHSPTTIYTAPLELVFYDLWGPAPMSFSMGYNYYTHSLMPLVAIPGSIFLKAKFEALTVFKQFKNMVELQLNTCIKALQSDISEIVVYQRSTTKVRYAWCEEHFHSSS